MNIIPLVALVAILTNGAASAVAHEVVEANKIDKPKVEDLLTSSLEGISGKEVILSHVALPPNTSLPNHWHPGEEFAYIIQGSVTVNIEGENEQTLGEGDVGKVPLKKIHAAKSGENGATLLVFRVHEQGQPGRVLVDN